MDWKKVLDMSNFVLLEDTADSHETKVVPDLEAHAAEAAIAGDHDDDDLQDTESSCCCGTASDYKLSKVVDCHDDQDSNGVSNFGNDEDDDEHHEKSTNSCCETSMSEDVALECNFSEEEERKIGKFNNMDEMEDRLFWETCMAEGYP